MSATLRSKHHKNTGAAGGFTELFSATRLLRWLDALRTGFWFVPTLMLFSAAGVALLLLYIDQWADPGIKAALPWAYSGGPEGARSLLSTIAGSMITAASVTFSLASVALSIASQQYGSRVLRNFMRDRVTQVLLGTFVSTFIYSVLVVRAIRGSDVSGGFVPAISVTAAIVLSLISLVLLIYFVHHVSSSIQASQIIRVISEATSKKIKTLYPSETGQPTTRTESLPPRLEGPGAPVHASKSGYLETVDLDDLMGMAQEYDIVIQLLTKPGDHLIAGDPVARVFYPGIFSDEMRFRVEEAFYFDFERTPAQDVRYQFQQLTDVVVRALSPGINDPFTAMNGIDELASNAALLARSSRIADVRQDDAGVTRLLVCAASLADVLEETVAHIALYAKSDRFVLSALRRVLDAVSNDLHDDQERTTVQRLYEEIDGLLRKVSTPEGGVK